LTRGRYVDYADFIPLMVEMIEEEQIAEEDPQLKAAEEAAAATVATEFLTLDMPQSNFPNYCGALFKQADRDGDGILSEEEFEAAMQKLDLGLTAKEIKFCMVEFCYRHPAGQLEYVYFVEDIFDVCLDLVAGKLLDGGDTFNEVQETFMRLFSESDKDGGGMLACPQLAEAMTAEGLLEPVQAETILMEATQDPRGLVRYTRFARVAACLALDFWDGKPPYGEVTPMPRLEDLSLDELVFFLRKRFLQADKDRNGVLSQKEFAELLRDSGLGLSKKTFRRIMAAIDLQDDGFVEYSVFVPVLIDIIQSARVLEKNRDNRVEEEATARQTAAAYLMEGLPREGLESNLASMFAEGDADSNGCLSIGEFSKCLWQLDLGLTKREINSLMAEVNTTKTGLVNYDEFLPLAYELLVEVMKEKLLDDGGRLKELQGHFTDAFAAKDVDLEDGISKISINACRDVLSENRLTAIQVETILSEATLDERSQIQYHKFARIVAPMAFEFWGGRLPDTLGEGKKTASMLTLRSPIARELADFRGVVSSKVDPLGSLWQASQHGDIMGVCEALADGADVDAQNDNGWAALHWAAHNGHDGAVACLIDNDANIDCHDDDGWDALHHAASQGHDAACNVLVNCGSDIDGKATGTFGRTPLMLAAWNGHASTVLSLINNGASINMEDEPSGMSAVHYAARFNRPAALATLLESGADMEVLTRDGKASIHFAAREGNIQCVRLLVEGGASLGSTTSDLYQRTALHWATYNGHLQCVQYLISAGAPTKCIDTDGKSPLDVAGCNEDVHAAVAAGQAERMSPMKSVTR